MAAAWRRLPLGGIVPQDYVFRAQGPAGGPAEVRLSELFAPGKDPLVIYSMMFPGDAGDDRPGPAGAQTALLPLAQGPCPSCATFLDAAAEYASQRVNLAAAGKAPVEPTLAFGADGGWRRATCPRRLRCCATRGSSGWCSGPVKSAGLSTTASGR